MESIVKSFIKEHGLDKGVLVIAVSGGVDSVVLLDLLTRLLPAKALVVAHVNHGLRPESKQEARHVRALADKYQLKYAEASLTLRKSSEDTARRARYAWLHQLAQRHKAIFIVTAHHLDDQLETVILRLVRGTGPLDIWGMKGVTVDGLARPLLTVQQTDVLLYAQKHKLKYFEDSSNQSLHYARNRIRHQVTPELLAINKALLKTIGASIILGQEAAEFLDAYLCQIEKRIVKGSRIDIEKLKKLPPFIAKEFIRRQLFEATGARSNVYQKNILAVYDLLGKTGTKETNLGSTRVKKTYKYLIFGAKEATPKTLSKIILVGSTTNFNGFKIKVRVGTARPKKNNILLPVRFSDSLVLRNWRPGDKIKTQYGTKKIQDLFTDAKVDRDKRKGWPVITHHGKIVWVPLLAASAQASKQKNNLILEVL